MASKYSVIRYVPDPVTDERINIGVVAFNEQQTKVGFLHRWDRVQGFASEDITFLKEFAKEMQTAAEARGFLPGFEPGLPLTPDTISRISKRWMNSIQITEPRASIATLEDTFRDAVQRFLVTKAHEQRAYRERSSAASIAKASIRDALRERIGRENAESYLKAPFAVPGRYKPHVFDGVVMNGRAYGAMQGLSFELPEARELELTSDALAWAVEDVHKEDEDILIGIFVLPPKPDSRERIRSLYDQSVKAYRDLGAEIVTDQTMNDWARRVAERVPLE
jgi:Protein of unknown function (DUF3037)